MQVFCNRCKEWLRVASDGDGTFDGAQKVLSDHGPVCLGDIGARFEEITSHLSL